MTADFITICLTRSLDSSSYTQILQTINVLVYNVEPHIVLYVTYISVVIKGSRVLYVPLEGYLTTGTLLQLKQSVVKMLGNSKVYS